MYVVYRINKKSYLLSKQASKSDKYDDESNQNLEQEVSPGAKIPKSPHCLLTKANQMLATDKKNINFNSSYDRTVMNSPLNTKKKVSPYRPAKLKKGSSIETSKYTMFIHERARKEIVASTNTVSGLSYSLTKLAL